MTEALQLEWVLWWYGCVVHPYLDHTVEPLVSFHDLGMRLP